MISELRVNGLCAGYGRKIIIGNINFAACGHQNLGIIGPNGGGKSTLLRCVAGTLKPCAGKALLQGRNVSEWNPRERARIVSVFSAGQRRPAYLTALQFVLLGRFPWLSWLGQYSKADMEIAHAALAECGISSLAGRPVDGLSTGQFHLAALARCLAQIWRTPQAILLLDEMTANLDLARKLEISLLLDKWRQKGHIIVQAIHDCNLAALFCTHLLGLKNGRQQFCGSVNSVFTEENLSALYDWPVGMAKHPDAGVLQLYPRLISSDFPGSAGRPDSVRTGWPNLR